MGRKSFGDAPMTAAERQRRRRAQKTFVVQVRDDLYVRTFGIYRSFKKADTDAKAWDGTVCLIESRDAEEPWNARFDPNEPKPEHPLRDCTCWQSYPPASCHCPPSEKLK